MRKTVEFEKEHIALLCQQEMENAMLKTEEVVEKNGKYVLAYYVHNHEQKGKANRAINKVTIG